MGDLIWFSSDIITKLPESGVLCDTEFGVVEDHLRLQGKGDPLPP